MEVTRCPGCGKPVKPRTAPGGSPRKWCGRPCESRAKVEAFRAKHGVAPSVAYRQARPSTCGVCGAPVTFGKTRCTRCAARASGARRRRGRELVRVGAVPPALRPFGIASGSASGGGGAAAARVFVAGRCGGCGEPFVAQSSTRMAGYCSDDCKRRAAAARRRALKVGAFVAPVWRRRVFERDKWRCQLCGKLVAKGEVVPHPRAPVVDHVVPLAVGGTHEPANAQTAHFLCNSVKGERPAGEQLRLVG